MRVAPKISLSDEQREALEKLARGRTTTVRLAIRAKMILMADAGKQDQQIADELAIARQTVARWRGRFIASGIAGIEKDVCAIQRSVPAVIRQSICWAAADEDSD